MKKNNSDLRHAELVVERIESSHTDITRVYQDWVNIGFALASLGEEGRELFHRVSAQNPNYRREESDKKFDNCLSTGKGEVRLATFMEIAKRNGIDINKPMGRPRKSKADSQEEQHNKMQAIQDALCSYGQFRFNTWKHRTEVCEKDKWEVINDRLLHTYYCRIKNSTNCSEKDVSALLQSKDFASDYNPVCEWLDSLPEWNPETDPDYIRDFFIGHIIFKDPENTEFYYMVFRKWIMCNVALWLEMIDENPIMPVLCGEQHLGKTYFAKHILPPALRDYLYCANPSVRIDKDFTISLSEFAITFLDEFSFSTNAKSDAYKYIITSGKSNERDAYAQFREQRKRRAGLIAATNYKQFIKDPEGCRRYPGIDVAGTVDLNEHPLPYEGAYAQALYLLRNGENPKPTREESQRISEHNKEYMEMNDCEEALRMLFRLPGDTIQGEIRALSAGEIQQILTSRGFIGNKFTSSEIGRAMKRMNYATKKSGTTKYLVKVIEQSTIINESKTEALKLLTQEECAPKYPESTDSNELPF